MQESDTLSRPFIQHTQHSKVTHLLTFPLGPSCELREGTAVSRTVITTWYSSDAIVDIESYELSCMRRPILITFEQLEDNAATHGGDLRLAPFA